MRLGSQRKAETITYLPIIPVRAYFSTLGALPETHRRIKNNLKAGQFSLEVPWSPDSFVPPKLHEIEVAVKEIESHLEAKQRGTSEITGLKRAMAGLRIAASIAKPELSQISAEDLASFFGTDWAKLKERIIANSFSSHNEVVFEEYELLDSDDVAISLSGRLRTPIWQLKRKTDGFEFVFIDEAQLFNENERRIFPYLSKGVTSHVPLILALDAAQEPFGFSSAGLAAIGIADIENEELPSNHRSTREIVDLAFFVIQQTTDLFGPDFPDFKKAEVGLSNSQKALAAPPIIVKCNEDAKSFGRFVVKTVQKLRAKNVRQIAVVCHGETYWDELHREFLASRLPLHILSQRGERVTPDQPLVILSRPAYIGGQEFDAVVLVGLEQGLVPPRIVDNDALAAAIEQQVLRDMYLSITRARTRLIVVINQDALPNSIVESAKSQSLISVGTVS